MTAYTGNSRTRNHRGDGPPPNTIPFSRCGHWLPSCVLCDVRLQGQHWHRYLMMEANPRGIPDRFRCDPPTDCRPGLTDFTSTHIHIHIHIRSSPTVLGRSQYMAYANSAPPPPLPPQKGAAGASGPRLRDVWPMYTVWATCKHFHDSSHPSMCICMRPGLGGGGQTQVPPACGQAWGQGPTLPCTGGLLLQAHAHAQDDGVSRSPALR